MAIAVVVGYALTDGCCWPGIPGSGVGSAEPVPVAIYVRRRKDGTAENAVVRGMLSRAARCGNVQFPIGAWIWSLFRSVSPVLCLLFALQPRSSLGGGSLSDSGDSVQSEVLV